MKRKINVNDLFDKIHQLCAIPFQRLEPLPSDSGQALIFGSTDSQKCTKTSFSGVKSTKSNSQEPQATNKIKTTSDVESLFCEIRDFCKIKLPFKLNDLDEADHINTCLPEITPENSLPPREKSKRIISRPVQEPGNKHSKHSYAKLILTIKSSKENVHKKKVKQSKPRSALANRNKEPLKHPNPISPLCLSSINLKSSINSCKDYIKAVKSNDTKRKACDTAAQKKCLKRPQRKALTQTSKDDSLESGYSSSQSSVPSPASTLLSSDFDENQMTKSSMSSNLSTATESSFIHNVNPDGEVIYLRNQYDYYLDRSSKRKRKTACGLKLNGLPLNSVSQHQKVIEWQSRTLLNNPCPTPEHNHFEGTPPHSPLATCDAAQWATTEDKPDTNSLDDDPLDFDCLQDLFDSGPDDLNQLGSELDLLLSQTYDNLDSNFNYSRLMDVEHALNL